MIKNTLIFNSESIQLQLSENFGSVCFVKTATIIYHLYMSSIPVVTLWMCGWCYSTILCAQWSAEKAPPGHFSIFKSRVPLKRATFSKRANTDSKCLLKDAFPSATLSVSCVWDSFRWWFMVSFWEHDHGNTKHILPLRAVNQSPENPSSGCHLSSTATLRPHPGRGM